MSTNSNIGRPQKDRDIFSAVVGMRLKEAQRSSGMSYREIEEAIRYTITKSGIKNYEKAERDYRTPAFETLVDFYTKHTNYSADWIKANDFRIDSKPLIEECIHDLFIQKQGEQINIISLESFVKKSKKYKLNEEEVKALYKFFSEDMKNYASYQPQTIADSNGMKDFEQKIKELSKISFNSNGIDTTKIAKTNLYECFLEEMIKEVVNLYSGKLDISNFCKLANEKHKWYSKIRSYSENLPTITIQLDSIEDINKLNGVKSAKDITKKIPNAKIIKKGGKK